MPAFRALSVAAVSSGPQATDEKASIPDQLDTNRRWADTNDTEIVAEVIIPGHSRYYTFLDEITADCPEYAEILRWIRSGEINLLLTAYYPRLYRTMELEQALMAVVRANGVQVYSPIEGGNLQPPDRVKVTVMDKFVGAVHGFRAESEIEAIRQRHEVGMKGRVRAGYHAGRNSIKYGYCAAPDGGRVAMVDEDAAAWVLWMFRRRAEEWGVQKIARELNRLGVSSPQGKGWSFTTVRRILRCEFYIGAVRWGSAVNPNGLHEPIVPLDLWNRVQAVNRNHATLKCERTYALSGLCRCGYCGWAMGYTSVGRRRRNIVCNRYKKYGKDGCQCNSHRAAPIERMVFDLIRSIGHDPALYWQRQGSRRVQGITEEIAMIDRQIADMRQRYERLLDLVERGMLDAAKFAERALKLDTGALEAQRAALLREAETAATAGDRLLRLADSVAQMDGMTPDELRALYGQHIARVVLWRDRDPDIVLL